MNPVCPYQRHRETSFRVLSPIPGGKPDKYSPADAVYSATFLRLNIQRGQSESPAPMHNLFACKHSKKIHMFSNGGKYDQAHIEELINTDKVVLNNLFPTFGGVSCSSRLSLLLRLSDSHLRTKKSLKPRSQ